MQMNVRGQVGLAVFWGLCIFAAPIRGGSEVLSEYMGSRYLLQTILVPTSEFQLPLLRTLARASMKSASHIPFVSVRIVTDRNHTEWRSSVTHSGYAGPYALAKSVQETVDFQFAEILKIADDAVLRVRFTKEDIRTIVLRGKDPLRIPLRESDGNARIEWISHWLPDERVPPARTSPVHNVTVFAARSEVITKEVAHEIYARLKPLIPHHLMDLELSSLPWFPFADQSPSLIPFTPSIRIPTEAEYTSMTRVVCSQVAGKRVRCR